MVDAYRNLTSMRGNFELLIETVYPLPPLFLVASSSSTDPLSLPLLLLGQ